MVKNTISQKSTIFKYLALRKLHLQEPINHKHFFNTLKRKTKDFVLVAAEGKWKLLDLLKKIKTQGLDLMNYLHLRALFTQV